ncbi:hypothetical protein [Streptosporangium carneum]|uniref:Uncharacterized protein n=1 Tax=Streptosporangium carneum TaxID=47481 RepID=A0A9W6I2V3_9ACTN|nr:hypothetical protein [Streptosporangium carneum]GLK10668.1 hypothetical protein GCM10017600_40740 [Streptosporangium carneum]
MLRRHRFGVPALLVMSAYVVAVAVAAGVASSVGDLGVLWRLTLFSEMDEDVAPTWPNALALVLAGTAWAWALWQSLRGPLAGPPPELDRDVRRLRVALYAAVASWLFYFFMSSWPWWVTVLDAAAMGAVVVLFHPVLARDPKHADRTRALGVLAYGGVAALEVLDVLGRPVPRGLSLVCGLAGLFWTVLVLRAQRQDGRWRRTTVLYGVASLLLPVALWLVGWALIGADNAYYAVVETVDALAMVWLARSAHDLADPRPQPALPSSLSARPQG